MGEAALVVDLGGVPGEATFRRLRALADDLEEHRPPGMLEAVPGYLTLTVLLDPLRADAQAVEQTVRALLHDLEEAPLEEPEPIEIGVIYGGPDGPDLAFVAEHCGLSEHEVVERHTAPIYRVHLIGFAPGFPYLGGLDPRLEVPRRAVPRPHVPAGSVGLAGQQTGVYSLETPGGWQLIGRTHQVLFDPRRDPPALLRAGDRLRFVPLEVRL
nr:5-oxoprolinase subunit PxpB [Deinobacterium chartae]